MLLDSQNRHRLDRQAFSSSENGHGAALHWQEEAHLLVLEEFIDGASLHAAVLQTCS